MFMVPPAGFEPTADLGSRPSALPTELWGQNQKLKHCMKKSKFSNFI